MAPPIKPSDRRKRSQESDESPSPNLWVGYLSSETVDSDLMAIFRDYGALDALTSYTPRTYAFVFFKRAEDAKRARDELQGSVVRGSAIRIEFARLAKPGKHMWIGNISSSVTAEKLEDELLQFGKIEEYKFLRDRNSAMVGYYKLDDAIAAQKNLNNKLLGGEQVRVDFQKPQTQKLELSRRDWPDNLNTRGRRNIAPDEMRNRHDFSKKHLAHGGMRDGPPSNTLWVSYPPSVYMDEQMLHNAMILFGEIEKITGFPSRHYSFIEFRSVNEARRAKEGLQGRLFGDPRIQILFSSSDFRTGKESAPLLPNRRGVMPDMLFKEPPFGPTEYFGQNLFAGHFPNGPGPSLNPRDLDFQLRPVPGVCVDGFEMREIKRSRIDGSPVFGGSRLSPGVCGPCQIHGSPEIDHCWRGAIAKGGSHVCYARCVAIGRGLESPLPEVINCAAKTNLDLLTEHYNEALGFEVVLFIPDSEEDFALYTEFLQYLSLKDRVGVAKCHGGTTLFLVPPSDFLTNVLNVTGPERLYGVILKLPHQIVEVQQPQAPPLPLPHYSEQLHNHNLVERYYEDRALRTDYDRNLHESSISRAEARNNGEPYSMPPAPRDHARNPEVSLTPELIATLTSLLPSNNQSSTSGGNNVISASAPGSSGISVATGVNNIISTPAAPAHGWLQEHEAKYSAPQYEPKINMQQQQLQQYGVRSNIQEPYEHDQHYQNLSMHNSSISCSNQHYQQDTSFNSRNAHPSSSAQGQNASMQQNQIGINANFFQLQQLQMAPSNSGDGTSQGSKAEKNQRYQSTLLLAASLLQKIQQQQQGGGQS